MDTDDRRRQLYEAVGDAPLEADALGLEDVARILFHALWDREDRPPDSPAPDRFGKPH